VPRTSDIAPGPSAKSGRRGGGWHIPQHRGNLARGTAFDHSLSPLLRSARNCSVPDIDCSLATGMKPARQLAPGQNFTIGTRTARFQLFDCSPVIARVLPGLRYQGISACLRTIENRHVAVRSVSIGPNATGQSRPDRIHGRPSNLKRIRHRRQSARQISRPPCGMLRFLSIRDLVYLTNSSVSFRGGTARG